MARGKQRELKSCWELFNEEMKAKVNWHKVAGEILGIRFANATKTRGGWVKCHSVDGQDNNPSAAFNVDSGYYKDWRDGRPAISAADLMVELGHADSFTNARRHIAEMFGIQWPGRLDDEDFIERGVEWEEWSDAIAETYCAAKPPITLAGLKRAGARLCTRYGQFCIALPIHNIDCQIIGWMFLPRNGKMFIGGQSDGAKSVCKIQEGEKEKSGYVCGSDTVMAIREGRIAPSLYQESAGEYKKEYLIYWCEGAPDMLAGLSKYPSHHFITNPFGCSERPKENHREFWKFTSAVDESPIEPVVIVDADLPGVLTPRMSDIPRSYGAFIVRPPYPVEEKHGRDFRDWLNDPAWVYDSRGPCVAPMKWQSMYDLPDLLQEYKLANTMDEAREKCARFNGTFIEQARAEADEKTAADGAKDLLDRIGLKLLGVYNDGTVEMYSQHTQNIRTMRSLGAAKYEDFVLFLGSRFVFNVYKSERGASAKDVASKVGFETFKSLLATAGSATPPINDLRPLGAGIWRWYDKDGQATSDLSIVSSRCFYRLQENGTIEQQMSPSCESMIAKFDNGIDWFDFCEHGNRIARAKKDLEYRRQTFSRVVNLFSQWNWTHKEMASVLAGFLFASPLQSILPWRPTVVILGPSDTGKSQFVIAVNKILDKLSFITSSGSSAGIFQSIGLNSQVVLVDEADTIRDSKKLMTQLRASGRGIGTVLGTTHHRAHRYRINHIMWFSGISFDAADQADNNRTMTFFMNKLQDRPGDVGGFLNLPDPLELRELGKDVIACALAMANEIIEVNNQLARIDHKIGGDTRYRESLALPMAVRHVMLGQGIEETSEDLKRYGSEVVSKHASESMSDNIELLTNVLTASVRMPRDCPVERATVADILFSPKLELYRNAARDCGVAYIIPRDGGPVRVALGGRTIGTGPLLRGTRWYGIRLLNRIFNTLPAAIPGDIQMIGGVSTQCTSFKWKDLLDWAEKAGIAVTQGEPESPKPRPIAEVLKEMDCTLVDGKIVDSQIEAVQGPQDARSAPTTQNTSEG